MKKFFTELADTGPAEGVTELVLIGDIIELWLDAFDGALFTVQVP